MVRLEILSEQDEVAESDCPVAVEIDAGIRDGLRLNHGGKAERQDDEECQT